MKYGNKRVAAVVALLALMTGYVAVGSGAAIARLVKEYPKAHFILAHCGRCFIPPNMETTLDSLPIADNLWLDTSAVCDLGGFMELLGRYDRSRILFGTDLVTSVAFRGNYIRMGMNWHDCTSEMVARKGGMTNRATYAAYESLAALCSAMRYCKISDQDREDIFSNNAYRLFDTVGDHS